MVMAISYLIVHQHPMIDWWLARTWSSIQQLLATDFAKNATVLRCSRTEALEYQIKVVDHFRSIEIAQVLSYKAVFGLLGQLQSSLTW
jgi:hypothetical protein